LSTGTKGCFSTLGGISPNKKVHDPKWLIDVKEIDFESRSSLEIKSASLAFKNSISYFSSLFSSQIKSIDY